MNSLSAMAIQRGDQNVNQYFMPGDPADSRNLVLRSGEAIAESVSSVLGGLKATGLFPRADGQMELALRRLAGLEGKARARWLSSPLLRGWVGRLSAALRSGNAETAIARVLDQIPNYFAQPEALSEFPYWHWSGVIEVADPALCIRASDTSLSEGCGLTNLQLDNCTVDALSPIAGTEIVVRSDAPSLRLQIDQSAAPQRETAVIGDNAPAGDPAYPAYDGATFHTAVEWLSVAWPEELSDWNQTVQVIIPFQLVGRWSANSFTMSSMQGACWSTQSDLLLTYESLVHEQSHIKLRYIEDSFPLLQPGQTDQSFPVGWRSDRRPIIGIFEGVYVHLHIAHALLRLLETGLLDAEQSVKAHRRLQEIVLHAAQGADILNRYARWTNHGVHFQQWAFDEIHFLRRRM